MGNPETFSEGLVKPRRPETCTSSEAADAELEGWMAISELMLIQAAREALVTGEEPSARASLIIEYANDWHCLWASFAGSLSRSAGAWGHLPTQKERAEDGVVNGHSLNASPEHMGACSEAAAALEAMQRQRVELQAALDPLEQQKKSLIGEVEAKQALLQRSSDECAAQQRTLTEVQNHVDSLRANVSALAREEEEHQLQLKQLKTSCEDTRTTRNSLEATVLLLQEQHADLVKGISGSDMRMSDNQHACERMTQLRISLEDEVASQKRALSTLQADLNDRQTALSAAHESLQLANREIAEKGHSLTDLKVSCEELTRRSQVLQSEVQNRQETLEQLESDVDVSQKTLSEVNHEAGGLRRTCDALRAQRSDLEASMQQLREECGALEELLHRRRMEWSEASNHATANFARRDTRSYPRDEEEPYADDRQRRALPNSHAQTRAETGVAGIGRHTADTGHTLYRGGEIPDEVDDDDLLNVEAPVYRYERVLPAANSVNPITMSLMEVQDQARNLRLHNTTAGDGTVNTPRTGRSGHRGTPVISRSLYLQYSTPRRREASCSVDRPDPTAVDPSIGEAWRARMARLKGELRGLREDLSVGATDTVRRTTS